jgi:hypothetical protein
MLQMDMANGGGIFLLTVHGRLRSHATEALHALIESL